MPAPMRALIALSLLSLAACAAETEPNAADALEAELAEGAALGGDPMVRAALTDPIMSDPMLTTRANIDAIRPPAQPYAAPIPAIDAATVAGDAPAAPSPGPCADCLAARDSLTLAALAARQPAALGQSCAPALGYSAGWAVNLPDDLPLHPAAHVIEAAGTDTSGCALRIVRFAVPHPAQSVVDWYFAKAQAARLSPDHSADDDMHLIAGSRRGLAYRIFIEPGDRDTTIATLIAKAG